MKYQKKARRAKRVTAQLNVAELRALRRVRRFVRSMCGDRFNCRDAAVSDSELERPVKQSNVAALKTWALGISVALLCVVLYFGAAFGILYMVTAWQGGCVEHGGKVVDHATGPTCEGATYR